MPTPGQISKENLKQILVFFPAVVYNICVVLFSFQLNYTTQKRICPACGLQILFCLLRAFFHSPPRPLQALYVHHQVAEFIYAQGNHGLFPAIPGIDHRYRRRGGGQRGLALPARAAAVSEKPHLHSPAVGAHFRPGAAASARSFPPGRPVPAAIGPGGRIERRASAHDESSFRRKENAPVHPMISHKGRLPY